MRRFLGALALGLPSAFLAHIVLYGNGHVMGGSYGTLLEAAASAAGLSVVAFFLAVCLAGRGRLCQGSMLTAHIRKLLPSFGQMLASSLTWFWLAESIEDGHAWAPTSGIVLALVAAAALTRLVASAGLRGLAKIAFACDCGDFKAREPSWIALCHVFIIGLPVVLALRLFSRPPPVCVC